MRYSRMQAQKAAQQGKQGGLLFFGAVIVIAAAIYLIGAAKVGNFLTEHIFEPVFSFFAGQDNDTPVQTEQSQIQSTVSVAGQTFTWELPAAQVYALQAGAYSDENNAAAFAAELQAKGGAGYVYSDGDVNRVFIAAYASEADAESVLQRLESEQQMSTKVYPIAADAVQVQLTADGQTVAELQAVAQDAGTYAPQLMALALSFDKGETDQAAAKEQLTQMYTRAQAQLNSIQALQQAGISSTLVDNLTAYYMDLTAELQAAQASEQAAAQSAAIKHGYMRAAFLRKRLTGSLA